MRQEFAEKALLFVDKVCKPQLEKAISETLGVRTSLVFGLKKIYNGDLIIDCQDEFDNVESKMTCNKLLKQLFASVTLRVVTYFNDEDEELGACFSIGVDYQHGFGGGRNGHDLMAVAIDKDGNVKVLS